MMCSTNANATVDSTSTGKSLILFLFLFVNVANDSGMDDYYAPAPVGEAGALGGHRRLSSVRLSV